MTTIQVKSYAENLLREMADGRGYLEALAVHAQTAFASEPWGQMAIRTAMSGGTPPDDVDPVSGLKAICGSGMETVARRELERLVELADPQVETVECHLFPCLNPERRGGFCYAPGKMLILIPLIEHWPLRVVRNITHEYSHTLRTRRWPTDERFGYGPAYRYTIREYLVFEGLADNLAEESHPHPAFPVPEVPHDLAQRFWDAVQPHRDFESWDAYRLFQNPSPDLPVGIGYRMGYNVVRRFLERTGMTALAAHQLSYDEILPYIGL